MVDVDWNNVWSIDVDCCMVNGVSLFGVDIDLRLTSCSTEVLSRLLTDICRGLSDVDWTMLRAVVVDWCLVYEESLVERRR